MTKGAGEGDRRVEWPEGCRTVSISIKGSCIVVLLYLKGECHGGCGISMPPFTVLDL
jgi:hypothetical protein